MLSLSIQNPTVDLRGKQCSFLVEEHFQAFQITITARDKNDAGKDDLIVILSDSDAEVLARHLSREVLGEADKERRAA